MGKVRLYLFITVISSLIFPIICRTYTYKDDKKHEKFVESMKDQHSKDGEHNPDFDHDVMWGGEDDDEVRNLPPEEQKKKLQSLVEKKIDVDKDGFVTMDELVDWTVKSFDLFETEDSRSQFPEIDTNKDGMIQWEEYSIDAYGEGFNEKSEDFINPPSDEWQDFVDSYKKEKHKFEIVDFDNSGDLDMDEFLVFKHPRLHEKTRELVIDEVLQSSDLNGDGVIDIEEFLGDFTKNSQGADPEWTILERQKFTQELDMNNDGVLSGEEIVLWMAPDNIVMAREEAEHLMEESDLDHDEKLSVEEIVDNYINWVESDATDYGRQLLQSHEEL